VAMMALVELIQTRYPKSPDSFRWEEAAPFVLFPTKETEAAFGSGETFLSGSRKYTEARARVSSFVDTIGRVVGKGLKAGLVFVLADATARAIAAFLSSDDDGDPSHISLESALAVSAQMVAVGIISVLILTMRDRSSTEAHIIIGMYIIATFIAIYNNIADYNRVGSAFVRFLVGIKTSIQTFFTSVRRGTSSSTGSGEGGRIGAVGIPDEGSRSRILPQISPSGRDTGIHIE